ncbi:hypothetical protein [Streptomyces sp. C184]|uniref:hypothetical protein n=1 Tax=Streptomyces sp. C184 TaxID=3237121 RepID=UPI0034C5ED00
MASTRAKTTKAGNAHDAVDELREALAGAGIVLPSLCVEGGEHDLGLIELGRVNAQEAFRLAAALCGEQAVRAAERLDAGTVANQCDDASPELRLIEETPARAGHRCPECYDLERGRRQAAAARDLSRVTDFNVLIARHRARNRATS